MGLVRMLWYRSSWYTNRAQKKEDAGQGATV